MIGIDELDIIRCAFCGYDGIEAKPGKIVCPECDIVFEIDDRCECVFVDLNNPRLPIEGTICLSCGLVQGEEGEDCVYCGAKLNTEIQ